MATTKTPKTLVIQLQVAGSVPEKVKMKVGATLADLKEIRSISSGYIVSVNGSEVTDNYTFAKNDIIRIGVKTKNA